ncbi:cell division protein FtsL [Undibacterium sp. LX40W]|uniref:Cell division protein FtsL n=1 Tax=Undibacterium nitidum TaxID=2762298 RepID=A0A923HL85_9BURK|nr:MULTISPECIES: cell division protein FtsL [Undibacterium]MBC3881434.1 cell division protein FtsL [Undibacterium nitidum]MBC3891783.1 cell division protein FtsL [Undibacterium sp. LX40W]
MGTRLNLLLGIILVACALSLINAQYQARSLFIELERTQTQSKQYELQWTQLKLDQSTFGKHSRIEAVAEKELNMTPLTSDRTQYLTAEVVK